MFFEDLNATKIAEDLSLFINNFTENIKHENKRMILNTSGIILKNDIKFYRSGIISPNNLLRLLVSPAMINTLPIQVQPILYC